jgi:hypothetical protein
MKVFSLLLIFAVIYVGKLGAAILARDHKARMVIVIDPKAGPTEAFAARELASDLTQITGAIFEVLTNSRPSAHAIFVGPSAAARKLFKDIPFDNLGGEELVIQTRGGNLLLAGKRPRGTLYAVSRFLQEECGVCWWTPWASSIPKQSTLQIKELNIREKPAFEYREPYWFPTNDLDWAWRNQCNGNFTELPTEMGGHVSYQGFVHTFYPLVPPDKYFAAHPEWFSLVNGKRVGSGAQLCLTNPKLRQFIVEQVKERLRQSPDAGIISVSQNDCFGACQCDNCQALEKREGSPSGPMLDFVNYIARQIEPEFPNVAVDTLAYQYTRKPPKTLQPGANVMVRLCSIECNFGAPMTDPSNASFADDIRNWAEHADRLYVWDYVTDFGHYVQPQPNWFVLGPNLRFFQAHHVRGVFEEGNYQSYGSEMGEMRSWVLAQLLWNPHQDDRVLIRKFLDGYYGAAAGPIIWRYLEVVRDAAQNYYLTCGSPSDAPFLNFKTLAAAEILWQQAEKSVAGDDELLARVRLAHLPVRYVWLVRWDALRKECAAAKAQWPLPDSRQTVVAEWRTVADGVPGKPWTRITQINEGGLTPEAFLAQFKP